MDPAAAPRLAPRAKNGRSLFPFSSSSLFPHLTLPHLSFFSPYRYFNPDEDTGPGLEGARPIISDSAYSSPVTGRSTRDTSRRTTIVEEPGAQQPSLTADEIHEVVEERLTPERRIRLIERLRVTMKAVQVGFHHRVGLAHRLRS